MAIRRDIRLRKEFLMKKQLEVKSASKDDRKRKLAEAVEAGKMIPTEFVKGKLIKYATYMHLNLQFFH
jgi:hypothetical protein